MLLALLTLAGLIQAVALTRTIQAVRTLIQTVDAQTALLGHVADACADLQRPIDGLEVISQSLCSVWQLATDSQQLLTQIEARIPGIRVRTRLAGGGRPARQHGRRAAPVAGEPVRENFDWFTQPPVRVPVPAIRPEVFG